MQNNKNQSKYLNLKSQVKFSKIKIQTLRYHPTKLMRNVISYNREIMRVKGDK